MLTILVLALGLMVLPSSVASGAQSLTVNGQNVISITLEVGQSRTIEVVSTDGTSYVDLVGFEDGVVLGDFSHYKTTPLAGDRAKVKEYNELAFYGYHVDAAGSRPPPSAGVHFIFEYEAQQVGETDVKLYDDTFTLEIDSVHITVIPLQPVAIGTTFTYQGRLTDDNSPADGLYAFQFKLYDNANPVFAAQQGSTIDIKDLDVIDGYFTVALDFGSGIFDGDARWLQIGVHPGDSDDPGDFVTLSPLQELTPTPYAIYAETAGDDNDWRISGNNMYAIPSGTVSLAVLATSSVNISNLVDGPGGGLTILRSAAPPISFQSWMNVGSTSINTYSHSFQTEGASLRLNSISDGAVILAGGGGDVILAEGGGDVGIGTTDPGAKLGVNGQIKITGGSPGADKVLTSDATGLATWQTPPASSASVPIGTVIDWWRPNDTFAVPDGYKICDGSAVNDAQSPFNGVTLPDLRAQFVRGAYTIGQIGMSGGALRHKHTISGSIDSEVVTMENAVLSMGTATRYEFASQAIGPSYKFARDIHQHTIAPHDHTTNQHTHGIGSLDSSEPSHLPPYVMLLKIMRIR